MDFRLKAEVELLKAQLSAVSILVLMDFRLKVAVVGMLAMYLAGFNPCSNGLSAQRLPSCIATNGTASVSILVLMDFRLKGAGAGVRRSCK